MFKLLLLGPLPNKKNPEQTGGAIVLFNNLTEWLKNNNIAFEVVDTNKKNYSNPIAALFNIVSCLLKKGKGVSHISLHSSRDYIFIGLIVVAVARLYKKETSLRKFGGQIMSTIKSPLAPGEKSVIKLINKFDFLFVETKKLKNHFDTIRNNTYWFPNVRNKVVESLPEKKFNKNFVFISHIIKDKGVEEIFNAFTELGTEYTIDFYGHFLNKEYSSENFSSFANIKYKGALKKEEVIETLMQYDVLLLPSYKEGYPGIIIEAYSAGVPVIATTLDPIKEICEDGVHGKLVEPKDVSGLIDAVKYFNSDNYKSITKNAFAQFESFDSNKMNKNFLSIIQDEKL